MSDNTFKKRDFLIEIDEKINQIENDLLLDTEKRYTKLEEKSKFKFSDVFYNAIPFEMNFDKIIHKIETKARSSQTHINFIKKINTLNEKFDKNKNELIQYIKIETKNIPNLKIYDESKLKIKSRGDEFISRWIEENKIHDVRDDVKISIFELRTQLLDLQRKYERVNLIKRNNLDSYKTIAQRHFKLLPKVEKLLEEVYESALQKVIERKIIERNMEALNRLSLPLLIILAKENEISHNPHITKDNMIKLLKHVDPKRSKVLIGIMNIELKRKKILSDAKGGEN